MRIAQTSLSRKRNFDNILSEASASDFSETILLLIKNMKRKLNKKMNMVKNHIHQEIKTWPKWAKVVVTVLLITGFFLTAAATVLTVKKLKKKKN